jgi:hypothetical protein
VGEIRAASRALESVPETQPLSERARNIRILRGLGARFGRPQLRQSSPRDQRFDPPPKVAPQAGHGCKCSLVSSREAMGGRGEGVAKTASLVDAFLKLWTSFLTWAAAVAATPQQPWPSHLLPTSGGGLYALKLWIAFPTPQRPGPAGSPARWESP